MKKVLTILSLTLIASIGSAQSLFFDNLKNSIWTSNGSYSDSTIKKAKEIPISKLTLPKDSIKFNATIWTFSDSSLAITYYDLKNKKESEVVTYKYAIDNDKGKLKIIPNNSNTMIYGAGITSTGNHVLLFREKTKPKKR